MKNVICDICGTAYPETAKNCPICGSSREYALENAAEEFSPETAELLAAEEAVAAPRKKNKEIFDFDEVNQVKPGAAVMEEDDFDDEDEEEEDEGRRTNVGLVIVLVILIVLLLLASGFFFLKYLLPNFTDKTVETVPVATTAATIATEPVETTEPTIPCTNLSMDGGKMELGKDGKKLLNVRIYPENTTDAVTYTSGDEAVVTVSEDGTVTAVGEGQTVITVQCGAQQISCSVTVDYAADEATVPEGTIPGLTVEDATAPSEGAEATDATEATEAAETTEATVPADAVLKLKKSDITISSNRTSVKLELEGDIDPAKLSWFTMDSTVAICHEGIVTSMGSGLTKIYGEYNGQQVMCIVRCIF